MRLPWRLVRLTTSVVVRDPRLWRVVRTPFRRFFDGQAPRWDGFVRPDHLDAVALALAEVPPPRRVLDLGTGTGVAAFLAAGRFPGAEVIGVDVSGEMVARAEAKRPPRLAARVRFVEADAAELPLEDGSCDLVVLANMIPFFDELGRVIAPGGALVVGFSEGERTPIWVPPERLRAELERRGFGGFEEFAAGEGTCLLARLDGARAPSAG